MTAILALLIARADAPGDYFPLVEGAQYTYTDSSTELPLTQTVLKKTDYFGVSVVPVTAKIGLNSGDKINYTSDKDGVYMIFIMPEITPGRESDKDGVKWVLVPGKPRPLFLWANGNGTWSYEGSTRIGREVSPITMTGETRPGGTREVLGRKVPTIRVHVESKVADGYLKSKQDFVLGKGVGIIESTDETQYFSRHLKRTVRLVDVRGLEGF